MDEKPSNNAEPHNTATEVDAEKAVTPAPKDEADDEFPSGVKVLIIMSAVWLSMFLVALVCSSFSTITTAMLTITIGSNNSWNSYS